MLKRISLLVLLLGLSASSRMSSAEDTLCEADPILQKVAEEFAVNPKAQAANAKARAQALGSDIAAFSAARNSRYTKARVDEYLRKMRFEFNAPIRCGLAFKDGIHSIIASPSLGRMRVERRGANLRVHVSWRKEYRNAEVWFRMKDGELVKRAISRSAALSAKLDVPWANRVAKVQLLAEGRQGPKVLAERWLHVTKEAPLKTDSPDAWLADLRRRAHVPLQVRRNELIDAASKAHARHMCESGHVVHNLGDGDVEERLKRYGLIARKVGEVISRAPTLNDALQGLAESPSHHATLIDKDLTDWGIGVLRGKDGVYCVAIIVAAWPRTIAN